MPPAAPAPVNASRTASRRPIVSTSGLTRSKGSVSQAGSTTTGPCSVPSTRPFLARRTLTRRTLLGPSRRKETGEVVAEALGIEPGRR